MTAFLFLSAKADFFHSPKTESTAVAEFVIAFWEKGGYYLIESRASFDAFPVRQKTMPGRESQDTKTEVFQKMYFPAGAGEMLCL